MKHYYTDNRDLKSNRKEVSVKFLDKEFKVITDIGVFSKNSIDFGTDIMLKMFLKENRKKNFSFLDIGCGYGIVALIISMYFSNAKILATDINDRAIELAILNNKNNKNIEFRKSYSFENIDEKFDIIMSNPPIRAGKDVIFNIYENSYKHLNKNGEFYCVIQTKHGAKSTEKKLYEIFNNCKTLGIFSGYRVYKSIKL